MMDPTLLARLAQIRQQEILEQAAWDRESTLRVPWARLLDIVRAFLQRRSQQANVFQRARTLGQITSGKISLDECPCE